MAMVTGWLSIDDAVGILKAGLCGVIVYIAVPESIYCQFLHFS